MKSGNVRIGLMAAAAVLLWAAAIAGMCERQPPDRMCVVLAAATTATIVGTLWRVAVQLRDDDRKLLLRSVADLTRPRVLQATRPLQRVR